MNNDVEEDNSEFVGDGEGDGCCCWVADSTLILILWLLFFLGELRELEEPLLLRKDGVGIVKGIPII